jgi:hypothetical protein
MRSLEKYSGGGSSPSIDISYSLLESDAIFAGRIDMLAAVNL